MYYLCIVKRQKTTDKVAFEREQRLLAGSAEHSNFNNVNRQQTSKRGPKRRDEKGEYTNGFAQFEKKNKNRDAKVTPPWEGQGGGRKPSREERGYTGKRGPMKKDDWKQFFQQDERPLRGAEPDFSEEGWARRKPKKR